MTGAPLFSAALALALTLPLSVAAQAPGDVAALDVLPGWRDGGGRHMAAVRVQLAPGWKTYWRAPGDAGIPPQFDWSGSRNLKEVRIHWPVPRAFTLNGLTSVGYDGQVVIPIELTPTDPGQPIALEGRVDMGVCEDVCIPLQASVSAALPAAAARHDARITAALKDRPRTANEAGVRGVACTVSPASRGIALEASIAMPSLGGAEFAVVELPGVPVWVSEARISRSGGTLSARVDIVADGGGALALDRSALRFTVLGRDGAVDIRGCD